jgi:hypothetical protein
MVRTRKIFSIDCLCGFVLLEERPEGPALGSRGKSRSGRGGWNESAFLHEPDVIRLRDSTFGAATRREAKSFSLMDFFRVSHRQPGIISDWQNC